MAILYCSPWGDAEDWRSAFADLLPGEEVRVWPELGDPAEIEAALVWKPPSGMLAGLPNLRLIHSLGAGIDHLSSDPLLPRHVPLTRTVDPLLTQGMTQYVVYGVLRAHRNFRTYERQQRNRVWKQLRAVAASDRRIGIMGLGVLGRDAALTLAQMNFSVAGWSRSDKTLADIECYCGPDELDAFLARTDILVCLLPLTDETRGILNARTLARLRDGAFVINAARGAHLVEADLIAALDSGKLSGALLDVFAEEPLPPGHPFWGHPAIEVTPHIASQTLATGAAPLVAENLRRLRAGEKLLHQVDWTAGY